MDDPDAPIGFLDTGFSTTSQLTPSPFFGKLEYSVVLAPQWHTPILFQLELGATKNHLEAAIDSHVLATAELMGRYSQ